MQFTVEKANPDEWERVREIRIRALTDSPDAFGSTLEREERFEEIDWRNRLNQEGVATFIATLGKGQDIGLVTGAPYDEVAGLFSMWVSPEARGTGVGKQLVEVVVDWAASEGFPRILLDVADHNVAAIALYKSIGFQRTGIVGTLPSPREQITEHQRECKIQENLAT